MIETHLVTCALQFYVRVMPGTHMRKHTFENYFGFAGTVQSRFSRAQTVCCPMFLNYILFFL